jgi:hypothetical protein
VPALPARLQVTKRAGPLLGSAGVRQEVQEPRHEQRARVLGGAVGGDARELEHVPRVHMHPAPLAGRGAGGGDRDQVRTELGADG